MNPLTEQLVQHDVDDTRALLDRAKQLSDADYTTAWFPGASVLRWDGADESIAAVLEHLVWTKEVWVAAIEGDDIPPREGTTPADLIARHESVAGALARRRARHRPARRVGGPDHRRALRAARELRARRAWSRTC